ncbi:hypothetical protein DOTSEDRAFT_24482 [Dothistroma septosporum NZE10]|uniref:Uncharacterized protein n=1 Tax=Dothistroma septosporum (strain NZE10 / CBS 128990) TaxID=675120 RepID=N1PPZ0_DOTSN|nr:hypothetical protein DOTSEDRAFT_24482 [Dothistroma septosporum NZE10]
MVIQVVTSTFLKSITVGGRQLTLKFARETRDWRRTSLAPEIQNKFVSAMAKADVPANAATAIMAESEHPSQKDSYPHFTVVYEDSQGNHLSTRHVYP